MQWSPHHTVGVKERANNGLQGSALIIARTAVEVEPFAFFIGSNSFSNIRADEL